MTDSIFLAGLRSRAAEIGATLVFPEAEEPRILLAAHRLGEAGLANPVLVGDPDRVEKARADLGLTGPAQVIDSGADAPELVARLVERRAHRGLTEEAAVQMVRDPILHAALLVGAGKVDGSVAGSITTTGDVLRAAIYAVGPAEGIRTVSSAFYMDVGDFRGSGEEVLTYTDAGVVQYPDAEQLRDIAFAACEARRRIVGDDPVVAFLSHSTVGSAEGGPVDRMREAARLFAEKYPEIESFGEAQGDAALIPEVAERKAPGVAAGGRANVLVFPDVDAGNISYKLTERLAGARAIGPIVQGLARPCNDLSRGASVEDVVDVACVTALQAGRSRD